VSRETAGSFGEASLSVRSFSVLRGELYGEPTMAVPHFVEVMFEALVVYMRRLRASAVALMVLLVVSAAGFAVAERGVWGAVAVLACAWLIALVLVVVQWWESDPDAEDRPLGDGFYGPF